MDRSEIFDEFLLEDVEFLLRTCSNSIATDKMELFMSVCEDLKFLISFLKEIPESFSENYETALDVTDPDDGSSLTQNSENLGTGQGLSRLLSVKRMRDQVEHINKSIFHCLTDCVNSTTGTPGIGKSPGIPSAGSIDEQKRALLERLTGGQKELEVINILVVGVGYKNDVFYDPTVLGHFDIRKRGSIYNRSKLDFDDQEQKEGMYEHLKGKRYLIAISVYGGLYHFGIWDDLKMCFPDDGNGSKILVSHLFDPFVPRYPIENESDMYYLITPPDDEAWHSKALLHRDEDLFWIKVRRISSKIFQSPELVIFAERINSIKKKALQTFRNGFPAAEAPVGNPVSESLETESNSPMVGQDIVVGFDDEELALLNRLTGQKREIEVILIAGMAGIGKTTMAKRLYKKTLIGHCFHVRAWASVSQVYQKGNILHQLLLHLIHDKESLSQMSDEAMGVKLYKCLRGKRFFIVIDDIWDAGVWNSLKLYIPDDANGSKVLMTSRIKDVALNPKNECTPHCLRFLSEDESWDLFERKVFGNGSCPQELMEMGKNIVAKCKGLPLSIVVVSGLISKMEKTRELWEHIGENIGSYIDSDAEQFMNVLELSYKHLPQRLKSCFLYLGAFPEDYEISVRKLVRMWIAEGFIQQLEGKKLEDTAEKYLMNLVDRSLVIVSRRRSDNGIKTFLVHDMLRKLCIRKAQETNFALPDYGYQTYCSSPFVNFSLEYQKCESLTVFNYFLGNTIDCLMFAPTLTVSCKPNVSFKYKLVRVLDLRRIMKDNFPCEVLELIRLKYLALYLGAMSCLPPVISTTLQNLETLIVDVEKGRKVTLPDDIWKMFKLRHLQISPEFEFGTPRPNSAGPSFSSDEERNHPGLYFSGPLVLHNLQTVSWLCPLGPSRDILLARIPNVRNLGFHITLSSREDPFNFFDLSGLNVLEKLKFEYHTYGMVPVTISSSDKFPSSLKKLTLVGSHVNWEEMSIIGMLPNLEVLKVKDNFFNGPKWETCEGGFRRLRFLKFSHMDLQEWIATADDFPSLEILVLNGCLQLEEIPSALGDICTLQVIEVYRSSDTVADTARQIQESQRNWGNDEFKVFIYRHFQDNISM
ncbi:putative late blight resistance protein homolog R1B-17 [Coffea eugenioides]|uniref:putative late blight resistance protein homolog R1B-17 n=1 Tax=Coffea eugenioides TaxID=49369 RepID=UPI000F61474E|nr:putative late blight resistance protein homolog R1B-17 [Coffea eugenioides]